MKNLKPFKWFCMQNFPFIEADYDAVTEWQLLQQIGAQCKDLTEAVLQIQEYLQNLDLQDEVNNKLNEMVEDGTMAEIINQEIFGQLQSQVNQNTATLTNFYVNVLGEGIKNDGTDVSNDLQDLIDEYPNGATFYFPNGTYKFKDIELNSNTTILGNTNTNFIVDDDTICKQFILDDVENIIIKNCNFQNGTTNEQNLIGGATANQKASIFLNQGKNIKIENCNFNIISGVAFIYGIDSEYIHIEKCHFNHSAYAMIEQISNCKHWYINENLFENLYTGSTGNSYAIASGVLDYNTDNGYTEDIHIVNNVFKNHLSWETIDSHGGSDYYIENNQFYECYQPISIFDDYRVNRVFDMKNIIIKGNYIIANGTIENYIAPAIQVTGNSTTYKQVKGGTIKDNIIISKNKNAYSGILLRYADSFNIENNYIEGVHYYAISIMYSLNTSVVKNTLQNCANVSGERTCDFAFQYDYNLEFANNRSNSNELPTYAVQLSNYCTLFENNNILNASSTLINNRGSYADRFGRRGMYKYLNGYPSYRATNELLQSIATENVMSVNIENNSDIVETSANALQKIALGENIKLIGAGQNNEDITAMFVEFIDNTHIRLSIKMYHDRNNVQVDTLDATWEKLDVTANQE